MNLSCSTILLLMISLQLGSSAVAQLVAHEDFNYSVGTTLNGQTGGTGFSSAWEPFNNFPAATPGLSFGPLAVSGNRVSTDDQFIDINDRSLTFTGSTLYASVLLRPEGTLGAGPNGGYFGVNLEGDGATDLFIGSSGASNVWAMEDVGGANRVASSSSVVLNQTSFLVVRLDLSSTGTETATLYVDPTPGAPEPATGTIKSGFELGNFTNIALNGGGAFSADEFRIGTTFSSVTPTAVPEPSSFLNIALVGVSVAGFRRWKQLRGSIQAN